MYVYEDPELPDIAAQWDTARNGGLAPFEVTAGSGAKAWWRCEHDDTWHAVIGSRTGSSRAG